MENAKKISGEVWKAFKDFYPKEDTGTAWDEFIAQGRKIASQYEGAEKRLAQGMFLSFVDYIENKEKG